MKSSKIWIRAVILVTAVVIISLFLSLFKGVTLYNLNFGPVSIGKFFFKLHNRIVLKIVDLNLTPTNTPTKSAEGLVNFRLSYLEGLKLLEEVEVQNFSAPGIEGNFSYQNWEFQIGTNLVEGRGFLEIEPERVSVQLEGLTLKIPEFPLKIENSYLEIGGSSLASGLKLSGFLTVGGGVLYYQGRVTSTGLRLGVTGGVGKLKLPIVTLSNWEQLEGDFSIPFTGEPPNGEIRLGEGEIRIPKLKLFSKLREVSFQFSPPFLEGNLSRGEVKGREFKIQLGWVEGLNFNYSLNRGWGEIQLERLGFKTLPIAGNRLT
ncbi:MAG: hypothetical protein ABGW77_02845, partial [Campylobacterales bacterium]